MATTPSASGAECTPAAAAGMAAAAVARSAARRSFLACLALCLRSERERPFTAAGGGGLGGLGLGSLLATGSGAMSPEQSVAIATAASPPARLSASSRRAVSCGLRAGHQCPTLISVAAATISRAECSSNASALSVASLSLCARATSSSQAPTGAAFHLASLPLGPDLSGTQRCTCAGPGASTRCRTEESGR